MEPASQVEPPSEPTPAPQAGPPAPLARARELLDRVRQNLARDVWWTRGKVAWAAVLAFEAVMLPTLMLFVNRPSKAVYSDMQGYVERAERLGTGAQLTRFDAFFPPGTHALMAPAYALAPNKDVALALNEGLWLLLSMAVFAVVSILAWQLFRHPLAAAAAAALLGSHAAFTAYTLYFLSEIPFTLFMLSCWSMGLLAWRAPPGSRRELLYYALTGMLAGAAVSIRPQFAVSAGPLAFALLMRRPPFIRVVPALVLAGSFAVLPALATRLNSHASGEPTGLANNGGFNFYQGHCPVDAVETRKDGWYYVWASPARLQRLKREGRQETRTVIQGHMAWENAYFIELGMECIRKDGLAHLQRTFNNVADFFFLTNPWPASHAGMPRLNMGANQAYCAILFACVPFALWRARRRFAERFLLLHLLGALPVAVLIYGDSRFRIPYDTWGVLLAVGLVAALLGLRRDDGRSPLDAPEPSPQLPLPTPESPASEPAPPSVPEPPAAALPSEPAAPSG
jgi:hypothetical protein